MVETPEQRVARLEAELAQAKVEALQKQLAAAQADAGTPGGDGSGWPAQYPATTHPDIPQFGGAQFTAAQLGPARFSFTKTAPPDTNLATAPRAVPGSYRIILMPFNWWILFTLFMIAVSPIALWIFVPVAGVAVAAAAFIAVVLISVRRSLLRNSLLRWGEVATVVNTDVLSVGTYYSGTTVQNVRITQAHGWQVERRWYSGPVTKTRVNYELRGTRASLMIRGLPYDNGVILADSRNPQRALCISSFPYDLERDPSGNWTGRVAARTKVGAIVMLDLVLIWTGGMVFFCGLGAGLW